MTSNKNETSLDSRDLSKVDINKTSNSHENSFYYFILAITSKITLLQKLNMLPDLVQSATFFLHSLLIDPEGQNIKKWVINEWCSTYPLLPILAGNMAVTV